jgi:hypothetical protein
MKNESIISRNTVAFIRRKINMLTLVTFLSIVIVFMIVVKMLDGALDYIPQESVIAFLGMLSLLAIANYLISKLVSKKATDVIEVYSHKLDLLLTRSKEVHEIEYMDMLYEKITEISVEMTGADAGVLMITAGEDIEVVSAGGGGDRKARLIGARFHRDDDLSRIVLSAARPFISPNVSDEGWDLTALRNLVGCDIRSLLCMPLVTGCNPGGVLMLCSSSIGAFAGEDEEVLQYFLDQASLSIRNSSFHEEQKNFELCLTGLLVDSIENIAGKKGHMGRVAEYALMMGHKMDMSVDDLRTLHRAAILHDIGFLKMDMSKISSAMDCRPHSDIGHNLLKQITVYEDIAPIVLHHHERYDGKGYPRGLAGDEIPLMSRIIGIAEAFDAMTNSASYRVWGSDDALPYIVRSSYAVKELKENAGRQFDPYIVGLFIKTLEDAGTCDEVPTREPAGYEAR